MSLFDELTQPDPLSFTTLSRMHVARCVIFALLFASTFAARADHAPQWLVAPAEPETRLAGIVVGESTVADAERLFGKRHGLKEPVRGWNGDRIHVASALSDVTVTTMHPAGENASTQIIDTVQVRQE